jgi:hypothetical protein
MTLGRSRAVVMNAYLIPGASKQTRSPPPGQTLAELQKPRKNSVPSGHIPPRNGLGDAGLD